MSQALKIPFLNSSFRDLSSSPCSFCFDKTGYIRYNFRLCLGLLQLCINALMEEFKL